jgi:tRNA A37 methylthiotransferase MiaB
MKGRIPTHVVKERSRIISELCGHISKEKNKEHIGKTYTVLVTEKGKQKTFAGRAENYKQVILKEPVAIGALVQVEIVDASLTHLVGKLI